jgi:hypothetical protein
MPSFDYSAFLTQAAADARYQAVGSLGSTTPTTVDAGDVGTAGVATSASRSDHEHPVSVTTAQLVPAATIAAWTSWTPTFSNFTLGNGTVTAKYVQLGKTTQWYLKVVLGSTSVVSGQITFTLPAATSSTYSSASADFMASGWILDSGTANFACMVGWNTSTTVTLAVWNAAGTYVTYNGVTNLIPMTWTTSDAFALAGTYEAA